MAITKRHAAVASLLMLTAAQTALAQDDEVLRLGTITLTATGLPTEELVNPASISVVADDELRNTAPVSVAGLLRDLPGVEVVEEGIERISIRGESSRRVAVLIDGQKLTDHTNYGQPVLIDPTLIERIEVVRGSSSVISGSQAIGGVVNIITRKGAKKPFELTAVGGLIGASEGWRASVSAAGTLAAGAGEIEYRLSHGRMEQGDRRTPDGILENSDSSDRTSAAYLAYRQGRHLTGIELLDYDLAANVPTGDPDFVIELPKRNLRKLGLFHEVTDLAPWLERLRLDVHRQTIDREFLNDITMRPGPMLNILSGSVDQQLTYGASLRAEMRLTENSRTVVGLEYEDDRLETDKDTVTTVTLGGPMPPIVSTRLRHDEASIRTSSIFGQHELDLGRELTLTLGGRWYDVRARHEVARENGADMPRDDSSDQRALFSAGLVWQPDPDTALRANISQGYVFPSLSQLFLSTTAGGEGIILGNAELKPERATTFELGARHDRDALLVDATLFYSRARDYIASVAIDFSDPRNVIHQYQNIDSAKTWGLELHAAYDTGFHGLTPYATATALRREFTYANGFSTRDSGTVALSGRLGLRKSWEMGEVTGQLDLFLRGQSGVKLRNEDGVITDRTAGFGTLNLHASADFGQNVSAILEINNITDRSYEPWDQAPAAGRSVNLFLTKTF
ncbi:TonB-dependent receptor [Paracoccus sp. (in: a-proteobacteria)]|uniref:TonB-dependent receptor n=1 Tax=Paracoccus sp. TaxID=267 RepID=UPI0032203437